MILVFDMDHTLYDEREYIKSGFLAVASFLEEKWQVEKEKSYQKMLQILEKKGRGEVFDLILKEYNHYSKKNVRKCVSIYRLHLPEKISLFSDARECLKRFKNNPLYVVTDGNKVAQYQKAKALGLVELVKKVIVTHRYGRKNAKPSPYCFLKIAKLEKARPEEIVYIGDDVRKDFVGIKPLGFKTVRILRGEYKDIIAPTVDHNADINIDSLDELTPALLKKTGVR